LNTYKIRIFILVYLLFCIPSTIYSDDLRDRLNKINERIKILEDRQKKERVSRSIAEIRERLAQVNARIRELKAKRNRRLNHRLLLQRVNPDIEIIKPYKITSGYKDIAPCNLPIVADYNYVFTPLGNNEKVIYLTFDDGPLLGTSNVLKVLAEENVPATMFFIGKHVLRNKTLFNKAIKFDNLLIANHTYSHANGRYRNFYANKNRVINDIDKAQSIIGGKKYSRLAGRNVWRLPNINRDDCAIRHKIETKAYDMVANSGYYIYGWDIEWAFNHYNGSPKYGAQKMINKINNYYRYSSTTTKNRLVLLAHDNMFRDKYNGKSVLRKFIRLLKKSGWRFDTLNGYSKDKPSYYTKNSITHLSKKSIIKSTPDVLEQF